MKRDTFMKNTKRIALSFMLPVIFSLASCEESTGMIARYKSIKTDGKISARITADYGTIEEGKATLLFMGEPIKADLSFRFNRWYLAVGDLVTVEYEGTWKGFSSSNVGDINVKHADVIAFKMDYVPGGRKDLRPVDEANYGQIETRNVINADDTFVNVDSFEIGTTIYGIKLNKNIVAFYSYYPTFKPMANGSKSSTADSQSMTN